MDEKTAEAMVRHWDWAKGKGLMNPSTAQAISSACRGILEAQDNWEQLNVETLDIEQSVQIFKNLRAKNFAPRSLRDYESRFRRAIESYRKYLDDPASWTFPSRSSAPRKSPPLGRTTRKEPAPDSAPIDDGGGENRLEVGSQEYRYPFRPDYMAKLEIPRDATTMEINRLVGWVRTLAVDYDPSP